jgi:hypothetical protein
MTGKELKELAAPLEDDADIWLDNGDGEAMVSVEEAYIDDDGDLVMETW